MYEGEIVMLQEAARRLSVLAEGAEACASLANRAEVGLTGWKGQAAVRFQDSFEAWRAPGQGVSPGLVRIAGELEEAALKLQALAATHAPGHTAG